MRIRENCVDFIFHSAWLGEGGQKKQPQITDLNTAVSKLADHRFEYQISPGTGASDLWPGFPRNSDYMMGGLCSLNRSKQRSHGFYPDIYSDFFYPSTLPSSVTIT